jgi:hypothetical protein
MRARAVKASRDRTVVVFAGLPAARESEGYDRSTMDLPEEQVALVRAVAEVARRTIVVLSNGTAVTVRLWERHIYRCPAGMLAGRHGPSGIARAPRELRGFEKVHLKPGESRRVLIPPTRRDFSHWDVRTPGGSRRAPGRSRSAPQAAT